MNLNDNIEVFENLIQNRKDPEYEHKFQNLKIYEKNNENETPSNKFKDFNNELVSLYRLHSSKFHSRKEEKGKDISDKFNEEISLLVNKREKSNDKINYGKNQSTFFSKLKNYKNIEQYRKKLAFRFRYMNYSPKKININKYFKIKDDKMNKILKISKSIPNFILNEINSNKGRNNKYKKIFDEEYKDEYKTSKDIKINLCTYRRELGFISPFKFNRYVGHLYNYYRSNHSLNEKNLIFSDNFNINDDEKMTELKNKKNFNLKHSTDKDNNDKNIKRRRIIRLNYLLSKDSI